MTTLYIAGPMYGLPEKNYPAFRDAEAQLIEAGYAVVSPLEADRFVLASDPEPTREWWQAITLKLMLTTSALALLPNWEKSKGASLEVYVANALNYDVRTVRAWLAESG